MISTHNPNTLHEQSGAVLALLDPAAELYHRLILVVGRGRSGKSTVLRSGLSRPG